MSHNCVTTPDSHQKPSLNVWHFLFIFVKSEAQTSVRMLNILTGFLHGLHARARARSHTHAHTHTYSHKICTHTYIHIDNTIVRLRSGRLRILGSIPGKDNSFFSVQRVQIGCGVRQASY